jgi:hypothetical protein
MISPEARRGYRGDISMVTRLLVDGIMVIGPRHTLKVLYHYMNHFVAEVTISHSVK